MKKDKAIFVTIVGFFLILIILFVGYVDGQNKLHRKEVNVKETINKIVVDKDIKEVFITNDKIITIDKSGFCGVYTIDYDKAVVYSEKNILTLNREDKSWYFVDSGLIKYYLTKDNVKKK
jgi:hypothetical protein